MTQEIIEMARDSGMELYGLGKDRARFVHHLEAFAKLVAEKALADPMREVQRLGQEIEQEPVGMVKDLFTSTAWEKLDVRGSTKVYLDIPPQPEQEPVAFASHGVINWIADKQFQHEADLYTTPPQRKPLTDEEMKKIWYALLNIMGWYSFQEIARAIEAAHGIKENQ
jgi:hypothetical protein